MRIRYFTNEGLYPLILPQGMDRMGLEKLTNTDLLKILDIVDAINKKNGFDMNNDDNKEYNTYMHRALVRMQLISGE